jgi:hypothetical protein
MRSIMMLGAGLALSSCVYYVPVPPSTAAAPPGAMPQQAVVVPAAPVYAYPAPYYAYPAYGYGYPWFGSVSVGARFRIH